LADLKLGVFVPQGWRMDLADVPDPIEKFETMSRCAMEAEKAGFDAIFVFDHFHTVPTPQIETTFECWTSMAALARDTRSIRLGQMVTCNGYRPPSLLAKMASCVDVMSHGRFDPRYRRRLVSARIRGLWIRVPRDAGAAAHAARGIAGREAMWTQERAEFEGRYYHLRGAINEPKSAQSRIHPSGSEAPARRSP